jgi:hypothetical protein
MDKRNCSKKKLEMLKNSVEKKMLQDGVEAKGTNSP